MDVGEHVEIGTHVLVWGEHQGVRVPCTDDSCPLDPHWERPAGDGTPYEANMTRGDAEVYRYHRVAERTPVDAVVMGYEDAPTGGYINWTAADPQPEAHEVASLVEASGVPYRRRAADGVWERGEVVKVDLPWAKPKLLVLMQGNSSTPDTPWSHSVEYEDVEVVT